MIGVWILLICISGLLTWLWFRRQRRLGPIVRAQQPVETEGFQVGTTAAARFWDMVAKLNDPATAAPIERMLDLIDDPDPEETFKVTFPRYISLYALAKFTVPEVYAVGTGYIYTKAQAQAKCASLGATLATAAQLSDAWSKGANWCFCAYVADSSAAQYVNNTDPVGGCGGPTPGIKICGNDPIPYGANCFGIKPALDPNSEIKSFNAKVWSLAIKQAKAALIDDYQTLQTEFTTTLYDQSRVSAWAANPRAQTCVQMEALRATFQAQRDALRTRMQDLSGASIAAENLRDENYTFQDRMNDFCRQTVPMPQACMDLANQEPLLLPLVSQFDAVNEKLYLNEIDIVENLGVVSDIYDLLNCTNPKMEFEAEATVGVVDTEALRTKLQTMSPYYLSPDVMRYITNALIGADTSKTTIDSTADVLSRMTSTVNTIRNVTNSMVGR